MSEIFRGVFDSEFVQVISVENFLICVVSAIFMGLLTALFYSYKNESTKSFMITLSLLPAMVCVVIMMVNGNIGAGVAVAGAFSLVRFRSLPGTAGEIGMLFLAMGAGIIAGMGYIAYGFLFVVIVGTFYLLYSRFNPMGKRNERKRTLGITIPEELNYTDVFDEIFDGFTQERELIRVKTINMGSMFRLTYHITFKKDVDEKEFIDKLRCRNGNLEIMISNQEEAATML